MSEIETPGAGSEELSIEDIFSKLAVDDEPEDKKEDKSEEDNEEVPEGDEEDKKEDEEVDDEGDDEEGKKEEIKIEDDEDELVVVDVPRRKEILKAFPDLFKKFPAIEKSIYREQQYTELFPSIADAREAAARLDTFKAVEEDLFSGNINNILSHVKKTDEKAFNKITGRFLQTIAALDKDAYLGGVNQILRHAVKGAFDSGKSLGGEEGEQLQIAARLINRFLFNSTEIKDPPNMAVVEDKPDPRELEISKRERSFNEQQLDNARKSVSSRAVSQIQTAINKYIDPKDIMTPYVKSKAMSDALAEVDRELTTDKRFRAGLDQLWTKAAKDGYSQDSLARIHKALLNRARTVLPDAIRKVRGEALKGMGVKPKKKNESEDEPVRRREATPQKKSSETKKLKVNSVDDVMSFLES